MQAKRISPRVAIFVDTATQWGREILRGVIEYSAGHGQWHLWAMPRGRNEPVRLPRDWPIDGIIARVHAEFVMKEVQRARVPLVNVSAIELEHCACPRVTHDYNAEAEMAVDHLYSLGLRHFGYVGMPKLSFGRRHLDAVQQAGSKRRVSCSVFRPSSTLIDRPERAHNIRSLRTWIEQLPKPVGILTRSVIEGLEVLEAARLAGIRVPDEAAVLACDDDDLLCSSSYPTLSGMEIAASKLGYTAAAMLDRLMSGRTIPTEFIAVKPTRIKERASTDLLAISDPVVAQAVRQIRDHAFEPVTIDDILDELCISRRALEIRFRAALGRTPREEIIRLRLLHAQELIRGTKLSLQRVAELCGYSSCHYLTRLFKKHIGMTIGQYRDAWPTMKTPRTRGGLTS